MKTRRCANKDYPLVETQRFNQRIIPFSDSC